MSAYLFLSIFMFSFHLFYFHLFQKAILFVIISSHCSQVDYDCSFIKKKNVSAF